MASAAFGQRISPWLLTTISVINRVIRRSVPSAMGRQDSGNAQSAPMCRSECRHPPSKWRWSLLSRLMEAGPGGSEQSLLAISAASEPDQHAKEDWFDHF